MNKKILCGKEMVLGLMILFVGASVLPTGNGVSGNEGKDGVVADHCVKCSDGRQILTVSENNTEPYLVEILGPRSFSVENPPTYQARSKDMDGDRVKFYFAMKKVQSEDAPSLLNYTSGWMPGNSTCKWKLYADDVRGLKAGTYYVCAYVVDEHEAKSNVEWLATTRPRPVRVDEIKSNLSPLKTVCLYGKAGDLNQSYLSGTSIMFIYINSNLELRFTDNVMIRINGERIETKYPCVLTIQGFTGFGPLLPISEGEKNRQILFFGLCNEFYIK